MERQHSTSMDWTCWQRTGQHYGPQQQQQQQKCFAMASMLMKRYIEREKTESSDSFLSAR